MLKLKNKSIKRDSVTVICSGFPSIQNYLLIGEKKIYQFFMYPVMLGQLTVMVKEAACWKEKGKGRQEKEKHSGQKSIEIA